MVYFSSFILQNVFVQAAFKQSLISILIIVFTSSMSFIIILVNK